MAASKGSGRGRVRELQGDRRPGKSQSPSTAGGPEPKTPQTVEGLAKYLNSLANGDNMKNYGNVFVDMFWEFSKVEERFKEAVELITDTTTADRDYVHIGVRVCQLLMEREEGPRFRQALMRWFQQQFQAKEETRAVSIEKWLSVFAFMCEIHSCMLLNGQPITVLGKAVYSSIDFLLEQPDRDDDELDCICSSLKLCGKTLQEIDQVKMDTLMDTFRSTVISIKTSCRVRCLMLEILELRAMGWSDPGERLAQFYVDGIADTVAEDAVNTN